MPRRHRHGRYGHQGHSHEDGGAAPVHAHGVDGAVPKPVVVLFDVDETLVHTGGAGAKSWKAAFDKLYGIPADIGQHTSAGETDPEVSTETFQGVLHRDPTPDELGRLYAQYLLSLSEEIWASKEYRVLPGAER